MKPIAVHIVIFSDRKTYQLQWTDPVTGKKKTKHFSAETGKDIVRPHWQLENRRVNVVGGGMRGQKKDV